MTWLSVIGGVLQFLLLCSASIFGFLVVIFNAFLNFLSIILAPLAHLTSYIAHGLLIPIKLLSRLETLYVFLGVAAFIGLLTGSILHVASGILNNLLHLRSTPNDSGRTAASVRAAREKRLEKTWANSAGLGSNGGGKDTLKGHTYGHKDHVKKKHGKGLLSQTILEEEDDSE